MRQLEFTILAKQTDPRSADEDVAYSDRQQSQFNESGIQNIAFIAMHDLAGVRA